MINITGFLVHLVKRDPQTDAITKKRTFRVIPKNNENELRMKQDIAKVLKRERNKGWSYWYVVAEIERADGTHAYRPVVKSTMF